MSNKKLILQKQKEYDRKFKEYNKEIANDFFITKERISFLKEDLRKLNEEIIFLTSS